MIQLIVMARWPAPGHCKRRLALGLGPAEPGLGAAAAARIQARLTAHALAEAGAASRVGLDVVLAASGLGAAAARRWGHALGSGRTVLQGSGGLGLRLARQINRAAREGAAGVLLVGSDLPELSAADLVGAAAELAHSPLLLGPACDGGYWLLGLQLPPASQRRAGGRRPWPALLAGIPWGSNRVLAATEAAARSAGLKPLLLAARSDLDRPADLAPWR